jgi:urocanate hydratase
MAIQNVIGDSFRGATWVSIHNGGGVGWGEVMVVLVWFLMVQKRLQNA